jgi:hypothetical protein
MRCALHTFVSSRRLAYVPEDLAQPYLAKGLLKRVLEDWCPPYSGYHLYYPSRRQPSAAFALLVRRAALRALARRGELRVKILKEEFLKPLGLTANALDLSEFENVEVSPGEVTIIPLGISHSNCR